jgi:hypothetical protein
VAHGQNNYLPSAKLNSIKLIYREQQASLNAEICQNDSLLQQRYAWQMMACFCFAAL